MAKLTASQEREIFYKVEREFLVEDIEIYLHEIYPEKAEHLIANEMFMRDFLNDYEEYLENTNSCFEDISNTISSCPELRSVLEENEPV